jgi:hypothetical protein
MADSGIATAWRVDRVLTAAAVRGPSDEVETTETPTCRGSRLVVLTEVSWNRVYEWLANTKEYLETGERSYRSVSSDRVRQ